jgi:hypothetical protein
MSGGGGGGRRCPAIWWGDGPFPGFVAGEPPVRLLTRRDTLDQHAVAQSQLQLPSADAVRVQQPAAHRFEQLLRLLLPNVEHRHVGRGGLDEGDARLEVLPDEAECLLEQLDVRTAVARMQMVAEHENARRLRRGGGGDADGGGECPIAAMVEDRLVVPQERLLDDALRRRRRRRGSRRRRGRRCRRCRLIEQAGGRCARAPRPLGDQLIDALLVLEDGGGALLRLAQLGAHFAVHACKRLQRLAGPWVVPATHEKVGGPRHAARRFERASVLLHEALEVVQP